MFQTAVHAAIGKTMSDFNRQLPPATYCTIRIKTLSRDCCVYVIHRTISEAKRSIMAPDNRRLIGVFSSVYLTCMHAGCISSNNDRIAKYLPAHSEHAAIAFIQSYTPVDRILRLTCSYRSKNTVEFRHHLTYEGQWSDISSGSGATVADPVSSRSPNHSHYSHLIFSIPVAPRVDWSYLENTPEGYPVCSADISLAAT